jgi:hypothetical protein
MYPLSLPEREREKERNVIKSVLVNNQFNVKTLDDLIARINKIKYKQIRNGKIPHKNGLRLRILEKNKIYYKIFQKY